MIHGTNQLQVFRKNPDNQPIIMAIWGYGFFAIPAAKFSLEEYLQSTGTNNTSLIVRAAISNALVMTGFSIMSAMYGYFGHSADFFVSGEFGFRFALKYICVLEPARMIWNLWGPTLLKRK